MTTKRKNKEMTNGGQTKGLYMLIALSVAALVLAGFTFYMQMQDKMRVGYVNSKYLIANYEGFKAATKDYQQKAGKWQANIDTLAKELTARKQEYAKNKAGLSANERKLSEELIQTKQSQLAQYQQGIQQKAQQEDQQMTGAVIEEINAFLKDYGKKRNFQIIFGATDMGNIVYATDALDLTEEVLEAMNKQYRGE